MTLRPVFLENVSITLSPTSLFPLRYPLKHGGDLCGAEETPALEHEQPRFLPLKPWLTPGF